MKQSFAALMAEDRRLGILRLLKTAPGKSANHYVLQTALEQVEAHRVSRDTVKTDLAWLEEQGLVTVEAVGHLVSAALTGRGDDVASGLASVPGVKTPVPGE